MAEELAVSWGPQTCQGLSASGVTSDQTHHQLLCVLQQLCFQLHLILFYQCKATGTISLSPSLPLQSTLYTEHLSEVDE